LDDFGLPSWTDYPTFYRQSEHPGGGHSRYISWMDEFGTGKRVPWKLEPVEFTEADWRQQFGSIGPMPKGFKCYRFVRCLLGMIPTYNAHGIIRIVNADQPSDGWFYHPPTISVDDVCTPGQVSLRDLAFCVSGAYDLRI
jgi:hypothetical protein